MKKTISAFTLLVITFSSAQLVAQSNERRQPPPEAFEVCEGQAQGDTVSITTPRGDTVDATCQLMDQKLVAVPDNMPPPKGRKE